VAQKRQSKAKDIDIEVQIHAKAEAKAKVELLLSFYSLNLLESFCNDTPFHGAKVQIQQLLFLITKPPAL
jgi:hypothetical protein